MKAFISACLVLTFAATSRADITPADIMAAVAYCDSQPRMGAPLAAGSDAVINAGEAQPSSIPAPAARELSADQQPTPMEGVAAGLKALELKPTDTLADFGCGFDCRWGITAARLYGCKVIAVERDPEFAASAKRYVDHAGLSDRIEVITGDATKLHIQATAGVAYLWPETLAEIRHNIDGLERFVSYDYAVPGLKMTTQSVAGGGTIHVWSRPPALTSIPITRTVNRTILLPRGSYCEVCHGRCSRPMAHMLQQKIVGYQTVTVPSLPARAGASQPTTQRASVSSGHWETRRVCVNGVCRNMRLWVSN